MAEFPYTPRPNSIPDFFNKIQTVGIPDKVTTRYLPSIGFKSSNDRYLVGIIKSLGFVDSSGVPTDLWKEYRNKEEGPIVIASAIRETYSDLFKIYPDAYQKDDEALRNFFVSNTSVGDKAVSFMVRTFKALCELADFDQEIDTQEPDKPSIKVRTTEKPQDPPEEMQVKSIGKQGFTLNVNIQLTLPETKDDIVYDKIFESIKKHFLS